MPPLSHPGVAFLDRDGTINEKAPEGDYITRPEEIKLLPGAAEAIGRLNEAGILAIVVTNQRGIALGRMSEGDLEAVHDELTRQLAEENGAQIDAFFHCPHDDGQCDCRKPQTGMFRKAQDRFAWIAFEHSVMIGDSVSDIEAGRALGMRSLQLGVDVPSLQAAVTQVLARTADSPR